MCVCFFFKTTSLVILISVLFFFCCCRIEDLLSCPPIVRRLAKASGPSVFSSNEKQVCPQHRPRLRPSWAVIATSSFYNTTWSFIYFIRLTLTIFIFVKINFYNYWGNAYLPWSYTYNYCIYKIKKIFVIFLHIFMNIIIINCDITQKEIKLYKNYH